MPVGHRSPPGIPAAFPRRQPGVAQDDVRDWPHPQGGQNGVVALPSRQAALEGAAPFDAPSPMPPSVGGQYGLIVTAFRGGFHAALAGGARPFTPPAPLDATRYVRRSFPNVTPIADFMPPRDGPTDWTVNTSEETVTAPASGVPFDQRRIGHMSFRKAFDQRIHADYLPRERHQVGPATLPGGKGANMVEPYFPRLTRRPETTSFGQTTQMLQAPSALPGPATRENLYPGD